WLIESQYEAFKSDPESVGESWREFFASYTPPSAAPASNGAATASEPKADEAPAPRAEPATSAPDGGTSAGRAAPESRPRGGSGAAPEPSTPRAAADAPAPPPPAPVDAESHADIALEAAAAVPPPVEAVAPTAPYTQRTPAKRPQPAAGGGDEVDGLRGPAARVVTNMESSLSVPTATSVRAIPAKLLIDNRIVLNNHLARSRGGKVSFTHLIGYALVEALGDMPEMNAGYRVVDGKPGVFRPSHVNLGLAIDLAKPDGTRQLVVPAIKGAEAMDFAQFWRAYEDVVRRA